MATTKKWSIDSKCEVYSRSQGKWFPAKIIQCFTDDEGEWIEVEYGHNIVYNKIIPFSSDDIRPLTINDFTPKSAVEMNVYSIIKLLRLYEKSVALLTELEKKEEDEKNKNALSKQVAGYLNILSKEKQIEMKKDYKKMKSVLSKCAPKLREIRAYCKFKELSIKNFDDGVYKLLTHELKKSNIPQRSIHNLIQNLKDKIDVCELTEEINVDFSQYFENQISGEWGGKSHIGFGLIGISPNKYDANKVNVICCTHYEDWEQFETVKINTNRAIWQDGTLKNFLLYQLWQKMKCELKIKNSFKSQRHVENNLENYKLKMQKNNYQCTCPGRHGLKKFVTQTYGFRCDGCGAKIPILTVMFGCRQCNYDLCQSCH
eukprot:17342_1